MTVVMADFQTAGRGQGANRWESERGKNLLCSIRITPESLPANRQYVILQAAALAVREALAVYADGMTIKWPNDIYFLDRKISGTLSECVVSNGIVKKCIIGIGVNVNQETFTGDAPNPVSLWQITGCHVSRAELLDDILRRFSQYLKYIDSGDYDAIVVRYLDVLYRRMGMHAYRDEGGDFMAALVSVEPDGHLVLQREDGRMSRYAFREVGFIIPGISGYSNV